jgi:hypothetical protein
MCCWFGGYLAEKASFFGSVGLLGDEGRPPPGHHPSVAECTVSMQRPLLRRQISQQRSVRGAKNEHILGTFEDPVTAVLLAAVVPLTIQSREGFSIQHKSFFFFFLG